jgi:anti-sigma factor RsiW
MKVLWANSGSVSCSEAKRKRMKSSQFNRITDELLSAYLDGDLSRTEREQVEAAVAADEEIAWRLESLRQTVRLLSNLPEIAPKRSFILNESMVGDVTRARRQAAARRQRNTTARHAPAQDAAGPQSTSAAPASQVSTWGTATAKAAQQSWKTRLAENWRGFWHAGNPMMRNLAAASLVFALFIAAADSLLIEPSSPASPARHVMQQEPLAAPAAPQDAPESAPAESVAPMAAPAQEEDDAVTEMAAPQDAAPAEESAAAMLAPDTAESVPAEPELIEPDAIEPDTVESEAFTADAPDDAQTDEPAPEIAEGGFGDADMESLSAFGADEGMGGGMGGDGIGAQGFSPAQPQPEPGIRSVPSESDPEIAAAEIDDADLDSADMADTDVTAAGVPQEPGEESADEPGTETLEVPPAVRMVITEDDSLTPEESAAITTADSEVDPETELADPRTEPLAEDMAEDAGEATLQARQPETQAEQLALAPVTTTAEPDADTMRAQEPTIQQVPPQDELAAQTTAADDRNLLSWIQWSLIAVAVTLSALWWRSREE